MKTTFILFGATGDLAVRKLFPTFYEMYQTRNYDIDILSIGRRDFSHQEMREFIVNATKNFISQGDDFGDFLQTITYQKVELGTQSDYQKLKQNIQNISHQIIIYLSIAPEYFNVFAKYAPILELSPQVKVIFEKPFGNDLSSALELNQTITQIFDESQIYRVDHYLGKEAIQNILVLRFANLIFEPLWNNKYIKSIEIESTETLGIGTRVSYYESSGALRDMLQSHLLQMLTLVCMEPPVSLQAHHIQQEKLKVLESICDIESVSNSIVFGQYVGYTQELGVDKHSKTETFVAMKLFVNNTRMSGVPIYLKTGKKLSKKSTKITIQFSNLPSMLYNTQENVENNKIIIEIHPQNTISLEFNIKSPNHSHNIDTVTSKFSQSKNTYGEYHKLLKDVISGDKTLFTPFDILKRSWELIDTLVQCKNNCPIIHTYIPGSDGPEILHTLYQN